jgi:outer membrane protein
MDRSRFQRSVIAFARGCAMCAPLFAQAQAAEGPWLIRARAVYLQSANTDATGLGLTINNKWLPEVDISYFFTPSISAELILTYPQKQTVYSSGTAIGSFKHLPPTLTAQYHFGAASTFRPYLGAGVNYTNLSSVNVLDGGADLKRTSFGLAAQVGADIALSGSWLLNVDVKNVQIHTDVSVGGVNQGSFKVDPWLLGVGIGRCF